MFIFFYFFLLCTPSPSCPLQVVLRWVWGLVLVLTAFEFCIAVSICVFSGLALRRSSPYDTVGLVVGSGRAHTCMSTPH